MNQLTHLRTLAEAAINKTKETYIPDNRNRFRTTRPDY